MYLITKARLSIGAGARAHTHIQTKVQVFISEQRAARGSIQPPSIGPPVHRDTEKQWHRVVVYVCVNDVTVISRAVGPPVVRSSYANAAGVAADRPPIGRFYRFFHHATDAKRARPSTGPTRIGRSADATFPIRNQHRSGCPST